MSRNGVVLGLSKVARLAKMFARRVQNQQRFTQQLLEAFNAEVQPLGCAALVEAVHLGRQHVAQTSISAASFGCFYAQPENFMQVPPQTRALPIFLPLPSSPSRNFLCLVPPLLPSTSWLCKFYDTPATIPRFSPRQDHTYQS